jgi:integrase
MTHLLVPDGAGSVRPGWEPIAGVRPQLAATACRFLDQIEISLRPNTVIKTEQVLAGFCQHLLSNHPDVACFADIERTHIESFKLALAARRTARGPLKANTLRAHLGLLKVFFDRTVEWGWDETPARARVYGTDMPPVPEPLPKALDDAAASRFLAAARAETDPLTRLCVEMLARTAMRVSELCDLPADTVSCRSGAWWLRVPIGKLRNDRYIPLHPRLIELLDASQQHHHHSTRLITAAGVALDRPRRRSFGASGRTQSRCRTRPSPPAALHPGHPGHQPGHAPRSRRRAARPSEPEDDHGLRPHLQPGRCRPVPDGLRQGRRPLRRSRRRPRNTGHATASSRVSPDARQRLVHQTQKNSTATSSRSAKAAGSSKPTSSSCPLSKDSVTTPPPTTNPTASSSSR